MKRFFKENGLLAALATGVMFGTSYPPFPAWALLACLVPLWCFWFRATTVRQVALSGFLAQFVYGAIGFNWIGHVAQEFGHLPLPAALGAQILFCMVFHIQSVGVGIAAFKLKKRYHLNAFWFFLIVATSYAAIDGVWPQIFPFHFGYPIYFTGFYSAQLAEFIGFMGLSLFVLLANAFVAWAAVRYPQPGWFKPAAGVFVFVLVFEGLGFWTLKNVPEEDKSLQVLLVQPNIGNFDKHYATFGPRYQEPVAEKNFSLTREAIAQSTPAPDLVVWPETAYPQSLDPWFSNQEFYQKLADFVRNTRLSFVIGAYSDDPPSHVKPKSYNAVFAFDRGEIINANYRKHILLAFGEYFPGAQYFPFLTRMVPEISNFGRGPGAGILEISGTKFLPLLCYEILDPWYVGDAVKLGGNIIVNLTNDSWFGTHFEPYQHLYMGGARSIEYRTPIIRATNTGFSTLIDVRGKVLLQGPQNQEWHGAGSLPYYSTPKKTFYLHLAPFVHWIFLAIAIAVGILAVKMSNESKRN